MKLRRVLLAGAVVGAGAPIAAGLLAAPSSACSPGNVVTVGDPANPIAMVNAPGTLNHQVCVNAPGHELWVASASGVSTATGGVRVDNYPQVCDFPTACYYNGHHYVYVDKTRATNLGPTNSGPVCALGQCPGVRADTGYDVTVGAHSMNPPQPPPTVGPVTAPVCVSVNSPTPPC